MEWIHPFAAIISGPSGSGKSHFIERFLKNLNQMVNVKFERKILYYTEWQSSYSRLGKNIEYREGLPQFSDFSSDNKPKLIILDDLQKESSSSIIVDLFTKGSHHWNLSVIFVTQNLFYQGRNQRTITLNASYLVIFKNPRDRSQISHMARQVYPENPKFLQEAYYDATTKPHGYILLDLKQDTQELFRVRTNIFPDESPNYVYVPKKI